MASQNKKRSYEDAKKQAEAAGLCVADIVKVISFDEAAMTVDVQPLTRYPDEDTYQTKPQILSVPVGIIYGGGFVVRPVYSAGDIGFVVYLDRDSDATIAEAQRRTQTPNACTAEMTPSLSEASAQAETPSAVFRPVPCASAEPTGPCISPSPTAVWTSRATSPSPGTSLPPAAPST